MELSTNFLLDAVKVKDLSRVKETCDSPSPHWGLLRSSRCT
ncbi:hypothetical protein [Metallosphaera yellowstonensis]|nr:hypothetical protein [Metallosphaera yellowstonensis]